MSNFFLGFTLCGSLVTCAAYRVYELHCKEEERERRRRRRRKRHQLRKDRGLQQAGRTRSSSPRVWRAEDRTAVVADRLVSGALPTTTRRDRRVDASGLARGTSAAARRTAQLVTEEIRLALGNNYDDWAVAFRHMDRDGHGDLTAAEFRKGLMTLTGTRLTKEQLDDLMYEIDKNADDRVDYIEFVSAFRRTDQARQLAREVTSELRRNIDTNRESLLRAFDRMDTNKDGILTAREFQRGLRERGIALDEREMKQLMRVIDADGDDTLDYIEFMDALESYESSPSERSDSVEYWDSVEEYDEEEYDDEELRRRRRRRYDASSGGSSSRDRDWRKSRSGASSRHSLRSSRSRSRSPYSDRRLSPGPSGDGRWRGRAAHVNI